MADTPPNHPDDNALRALSLGMLAEGDLTRVSVHLSDCPACCRRIDDLVIDDRLAARLRNRAGSTDKVLVSPAQRRSAVRALRRSHESVRSPDPVAAPAIQGRQVGDYDIVAEVGRGGMG